MKRRRNIGLLLLGVCAAAVVWVIWLGEREPSYRGRKLSEWISLYALSPRDQEAGEAIRQIGTNALPSLLKWIQYEEPGWRARLVDWLDGRPTGARYNPMLRRLVEGPAGARARAAIMGFEALGDKAWPAVPDLARIMYKAKSGRTWGNAKYALANLPGDTVLLLAEGLMDKSADTRASVAAYLSAFAVFPKESFLDPAPSVPLLVKAMNDGDPRVVVAAAESLGRLAVRADLSVPALTNKLSSPTEEVRIAVAGALEGFEGQAHAAVPSLIRALTDGSVAVRVAVTNALYAVAPDVLAAQVRR